MTVLPRAGEQVQGTKGNPEQSNSSESTSRVESPKETAEVNTVYVIYRLNHPSMSDLILGRLLVFHVSISYGGGGRIS